MIQRMMAAIDRLDADFRSVLILRDLEDMDYQQIGETLDIKVGTVKSRLHRARQNLKAFLERHERIG